VALTVDGVDQYVKSNLTFLKLSITLRSENGAAGVDADPNKFTFFSSGFSGYAYDGDETPLLPDACSPSVVVPVDGAASCSIVFYVSDTSGRLAFDDDTYSVSVDF